jgi:protein ImuB
MHSWIGIYLPLLPLETFRPRWCEPGNYVVVDREQVFAASRQAADRGVRSGMRRAGVHALCPDAVLHERDIAREQMALENIAIALLKYTPEIALTEESSLLLDVTASLRAFGGRLALCRLVRASLHGLGFTPQIGMAPTAYGAWLLARQPGSRSRPRLRRVVRLESMMRRLDALHCLLLPAARPYQDWLQGIGCRSLGELRKLPRAGLQRRCDRNLLDMLDRAYGDAPALFRWVQAPKTFSARLELPDRIEHAEAVLFAARRLLLQMTGWLTAQQLAVSQLVLLLEHERGRVAIPPTPMEIALADPVWHEEHLVRLLKEHLARLVLAAPVIALRLEATRLVAMLPPTESLFPEPGGTPAEYHRLLELLAARLGGHNVLIPAPRADHRPEACNAWLPAATAARPAVPAPTPDSLERPFWILETPLALTVRGHHPFYGSPLRRIKGPERIESGWWDDAPAIRDYFIFQDADAVCYWIYRERAGDEIRWFLHGLFA